MSHTPSRRASPTPPPITYQMLASGASQTGRQSVRSGSPASGRSHRVSEEQATLKKSVRPGENVVPETSEPSSAKKDSSENWSMILDVMQQHDERMIEGWNADLGNYLIFAGLFSAAVTAFTVESYTWLSQDTGDLSAQILAQISVQLSSLSTGPGFINSTAPSVHATPFRPSPLSIRVNTLWFLSLSVSLIAALFIILAQQWLREYRLQTVSSVRESVRLRHFRYKGLIDWGVPEIVSILPMLLQLSLVFFLVGLIDLLLSLNHVVGVTITVILCVCLLFFLITTVLPIFSSSCAYRSPFVWISLTVFHFFLALLRFAIAVFIVAVVFWPAVCVYLLAGFSRQHAVTVRFWAWLKPLGRFMRHVQSAGSSTNIQLLSNAFWSARDIPAIHRAQGLDAAALKWMPLAMPGDGLASLRPCLDDLDEEDRTGCALAWVGQSVNLKGKLLRYITWDFPCGIIGPDTFENLDPAAVLLYRDLLIDTLPTVWDDQPAGLVNGPDMLTVLYFLVRVAPEPDAAFKRRYTEQLLAIRPKITLGGEADDDQHARFRIVTRSLYYVSTSWGTLGKDIDVTTLLSRAVSTREAFQDWAVEPVCWPRYHESFLCESAVALVALSRDSARLEDDSVLSAYTKLLESFNSYIDKALPELRTLGDLVPQASLGRQGISIPLWISLLQALSMIVRSRSDHSEQLVSAIVTRLDTAFRGDSSFVEPMVALHDLRDVVEVKKVFSEPKDEPVVIHGDEAVLISGPSSDDPYLPPAM